MESNLFEQIDKRKSGNHDNSTTDQRNSAVHNNTTVDYKRNSDNHNNTAVETLPIDRKDEVSLFIGTYINMYTCNVLLFVLYVNK
jgi:hypothetical protein